MKIRNDISRKVIQVDNGILVYEKVSSVRIGKPFWGITSNVIDRLNETNEPYVIRLVWEGHGGIEIDKNEITSILDTKNIAGDGDYKFTYLEISKFKAKWNPSITKMIN